MRHGDPGKFFGQNKGQKGENPTNSKTYKKKSSSISTPGLAASGFVPVYFLDLASSEGHEDLDVHCYSIQRKFSCKKMRDKIQTISTKESSPAVISELPVTDFDPQITKDTNSSSLNPLKQLNIPLKGTCYEPDMKLPKHKFIKKSSKRVRDDNDEQILPVTNPGKAGCRKNENQFLEINSETEIASTPKTSSKGRKRQKSSDDKHPPVSGSVSNINKDSKQSADIHEISKFLEIDTPKQKRSQFSSSQNDSDVGTVLSAEVQETNLLDKNKWNNVDIETSTPKSTTKNKNRFSPGIALSPELSTPESSKLPLSYDDLESYPKGKLASSFSQKDLDHSSKANSSTSTLSSNKSMFNASSNSISSKTKINKSDRGFCFADHFSNQTFSTSSLGNGLLATPKTPDSYNYREMQQWKLRRGMSDIGPRSSQNLAWRDNLHGSSNTQHASYLDTPPYPRLRERLMDNRHLLPNKYSNASVEKYHSFQHRYQARNFDWKSNFLNQCWRLQNKFIDSHCHLDFLFDRLPFEGSFQKFYRKNLDSFPCNFGGCVAVFCEPRSFTSEGLWKQLLNDDMVWLAMGCHPKKATGFDDAAEKGLRDCIKHPKVVAVGEIGLDYSGQFIESAKHQKKVFVCQIKMALAVKKPLVIHCRDAQDDCLKILKKYVPSDYRIHCHCFTKSFDLAKEWLDYFPNLYMGLTPLVTYPSAKEVHDTARKIPLERLLLETDTPYFVPKLVPRGMMKFSHPGLAITVAFEVAKLKGTNVETVLKHCLENTKQMYGILK